ncbi:uncharacterized protein PAC_12722 [Phialocephala subalpina]|uniref:AB hydrolase-1 domain-containing protein n=1 Tax=Phialocephala subalpina TaxID=576137 RepID=A0A1L7XCS7_9HELO|nr:uncharacterized protein PAC_12722 [Phialocephala subalpina]
MKKHVLAILAGLGLLSFTFASPLQSRNNGTMVYSYNDVKPSTVLSWTPCWNNFTCTMFEVPLDYTDPSIGSMGVAFIKKASLNATAEDLIINPGGPGGSGVDRILTASADYEEIVGPNYNLISFDPRGVNNSRTGIELNCFPENLPASIRFSQDVLDRPVDDTSRETLYEAWKLARGWGERCTAVQPANQTNKFANTVAVSNDMLRYAELRARSLGLPEKESKLWFMGQSYGTVLSATFAPLFPDRIGRMILDGVVDADDYYTGGWETSLIDTDKAAASFFTYCYEAGSLCAFNNNAINATQIEQRFFKIFEDIRQSPILISDPLLAFTPVLIAYQELKSYFFNALYDANTNFPTLASVLTDLEQRNGTSLGVASGRLFVGAPANYTDDTYLLGQVRTQIACMDANGRFNMSTFEKYEDHVQFLLNQSFYGGNTIASVVGTPCGGLRIKSPQSQMFNGSVSANKTSSPILFISNTLDPVTPLHSAKMSSQFGGSAVLTVDGPPGHTSRRVRSECTWEHIRGYLADGSLPAPSTVCDADENPFFAGLGAGGP